MTINKFLSVFLFLLVLFPYITIINTPFDTQPYAVVVSFIIIIIYMAFRKNLPLPKMIIPYGVIFIYSVMLFMLDISVVGLRSLVGYATVLFVSLAAYLTFNKISGKQLQFAVKVWLIVGLIQQFTVKTFGSLLVPRISTSASRGVTSLAVEPSYYSVVCVFFLILNDVFFARGNYNKKTHRNTMFLIFIQFLLSRSGIGFVLFFVYLISKLVAQVNLRKIIKWSLGIMFFTVAALFLFTTIPALKITRIGVLINLFISSPKLLLLSDGSTADRFSHIAIPFLSIFFSKGIGFGFGAWDDNVMRIASSVGGLIYEVANVNLSYGNRIMSGWGAAIFELGIFGLLLLFTFFQTMRKGILKTSTSMKSLYISSLITITFTMLMAVPLALPLFGYLIGVFVYIQSESNQNKKNKNSK